MKFIRRQLTIYMKFTFILVSNLNARVINKRDFLDFFIPYLPMMNISKISMIF